MMLFVSHSLNNESTPVKAQVALTDSAETAAGRFNQIN